MTNGTPARLCTKCGATQTLNGGRVRCVPCASAYNLARKAKNAKPPIDRSVCKICSGPKTFSGHQWKCPPCVRAAGKKSFEKHREVRLQDSKDYRGKNKEAVSEVKKLWWSKNRQEVLARWKETYPQRQEAHREYNRTRAALISPQAVARAMQWRKDNPGMHAANTATRRSAKLRATLGERDATAIKRIYAEAKRFSSLLGITLHVDHIVPLVSPDVCGLHVWANLQLLERGENSRKSNRIWPDQP
jgi:hypothetical protein